MEDASPAWETSKENMQPLRGGRTVPESVAPSCDTNEEKQRRARCDVSQRALTRRLCSDFEAELAAYAGDDPLSLWLRCAL